MERSTATLGARLREARQAADLTQVELAARLDVTQGMVSAWERGDRIPRTMSIFRLAMALGVSADWLLGLAPSAP